MKKMRKAIVVLLVLSIVCCAFAGCSSKKAVSGDGEKATASNEDYFKWDYVQDGVITGYSELGLKQKEIVIPAKCTGFGYSALTENKTVEKISFEEGFSAEILADYLFSQCTSLKQVILPDSLTVVSKGLLMGCTQLEEVDIPENVTVIEKSSFKGCEALRSVTMGDLVATIEKEAFLACTALETVEFSASLTKIEEDAFKNNEALKTLEFPSTLETIGSYAFFNCHALNSVKLPEGLKVLSDFSFVYCDNLTEIYLPASLTQLDKPAFGQTHEIDVYVKEGSLADTEFENHQDGSMSKKYY